MLTTSHNREDRPRRVTPDVYVPRRRSNSRESAFRKPHSHRRTPSRERGSTKHHSGHPPSFDRVSRKHRDSERWERDSVGSESRGYRRSEPFRQAFKGDRDSGSHRKRSVSRESGRHRSPDRRRPRSPADKHSSLASRDSTRIEANRVHSSATKSDARLEKNTSTRHTRSPHRRLSPLNTSAPKFIHDHDERRKEKAHSHRHRSPDHPPRRAKDEKARESSRGRDRRPHRESPEQRHGRSRTPVRSNTPDGKMSWRPPYDNRGHPPPRGGWPPQDNRYSHSPPFHGGYHGSPQGFVAGAPITSRLLTKHRAHPSSYSPQQSPYPPNSGHPDPGYFHQQQQSPPFNRPPAHHGSPPYQHGSQPQTPNGSYPTTRGGYRGSQAPYNQRFPQVPQVQTAGPHVRNLSWTPKTGTRGGHAPTVHGAALQAAAAESTTPAQETPNVFNGTDNPFRPASKELRVDDEAGKTGKIQTPDQGSPVKTAPEPAQQHSPSIRFGLPKTGVAPVVAKPNAFEIKKKNPFEQPAAPASASNERYTQRAPPLFDARTNRDTDRRREDYAPRQKGPKGVLKLPDRSRFQNQRRTTQQHFRFKQPYPPSMGDKELRQKLRRLRSIVLSKGHSLKDLQWTALKPATEGPEDDDPPGLVQALANKAVLEEEAYRDHPDKRPKGKMPLLRDGEVLDKIFTKNVVAIKYKVRRPQKVLPAEYRNSNVYYRKPGNESVVGFGTYGKVFKAKHIYKGKDVALKRLRMEAEKDGFPITAMREMKILKHLEQREADGVIRLLEVLYEVNLAGSVGCFMAFEYMPHDLTGLLNHPTFNLSDAQKKDLSYQMIDAIGFMHRQGVLHRDIKAANILVSHKGQIKLADFGLARFYDMDKQLHYTNRVVTIWYRAPELLYGQTEYGPPIDIWAAACVIVEIFTKHAIFPGSGRELNQLLKLWEVLGFPTIEEWPDISKTEWFFMMRPKDDMRNVFAEKYQHRVSPELFDLLGLMLKYNPAERPTAEQCLEHPFFKLEGPEMQRVIELEELGDWHELESKRARKQREADERSKKELEHDFLYGPPSCGQHVSASRKDKDYKKLKAEKRSANFSPIEPEAKKAKT
jgi:CTD kinase subunit alpha